MINSSTLMPEKALTSKFYFQMEAYNLISKEKSSIFINLAYDLSGKVVVE